MVIEKEIMFKLYLKKEKVLKDITRQIKHQLKVPRAW